MAEIRTVPCPMCGRTAGRKVVLQEGSTWRKKGATNFWATTLDFDPDKPFGVIMETSGRGTLRKAGTFQPEEDTEYFPLVKSRLLNVIKEWVTKGWISQSEVAAAARGLVEVPTPAKKKKRTS